MDEKQAEFTARAVGVVTMPEETEDQEWQQKPPSTE